MGGGKTGRPRCRPAGNLLNGHKPVPRADDLPEAGTAETDRACRSLPQYGTDLGWYPATAAGPQSESVQGAV